MIKITRVFGILIGVYLISFSLIIPITYETNLPVFLRLINEIPNMLMSGCLLFPMRLMKKSKEKLIYLTIYTISAIVFTWMLIQVPLTFLSPLFIFELIIIWVTFLIAYKRWKSSLLIE